MTSREYFASAMEAAQLKRDLEERVEQRSHAMTFHGRSGQTLGHGVILDPMRNVDEALDANAEDERAISCCEGELSDAWDVVGGIAELSSDEAAQVVCRHYLWLDEWDEIARSLGHTETECQALLEITLDWCDEIGLARLREIGARKSGRGSEIAHASGGNRG